MKKIFYLFTTIILLTSCTEDSTSNVSRVTNYPNLELLGDETIILPSGTEFNDPGIIATENGIEIPYTTSVSGLFRGGSSLDTNIVDIYTITYKATNQDGFSGSIIRTVIIAQNDDLTTGLSGIYKSTVTRNGSLTAQYTNMEYVLIWENSNGTYELSDGIGGYYHYGRGYGAGYAATGAVVTVNDFASNNFSYSSFEVGGFGGACVMSSMIVNASSSSISFTTEWDAGYTFEVVLDQVQF